MDGIYSQYDIDELEDRAGANRDEHMSIEQELEQFRKQWREELFLKEYHDAPESDHASRAVNTSGSLLARGVDAPSIEEEAKYLFLQGVAAEERSQLADAIRYYRKAIQLVPDIEFKIGDYKPYKPYRERKERTISECSVDSTGHGESVDDEDISDLLQHFSKLKIASGPLCQMEFKRPGIGMSSLPAEVVHYILKWLVSTDLDVVSLENTSMVCRGFFVASRDEGLWRLICQRIWGLNAGDASNYGTYRGMYYNRPRLRFNGCYISKTVYYRQGENSFDSFYRPFHMVEYYRYLRFYPEGHVLMLTTADDPFEIVHKLKHKNCKCQGLLYGWYRLVGDRVSMVMRRRKVDYNVNAYSRYRRKGQNNEKPESDRTFHLELQLESAGRRSCSKLVWKHYSSHTKNRASGEESTAEFDLTQDDYPALLFSRVRSYTITAEKPLS